MFKKISIVIALLMVFTLVAGCTSGNTAKSGKLQVYGAFATPIEEAWDGAIHQALLKAESDGLIDYNYTENIGYSGDMERVLREICEKQKPDLIVGDAFVNEEAVRRVAADYPEIDFAFGSELGPTAPNLAVFDNWIHEPAYLAGMLAGGMTKTNTVGVVAAVPIPEVNRLVNAFIAGAKEANPDVTVLVSFIGSFMDLATAKEQALAEIDAGADILYAERQGVIEAAAEKGVLAIGNMLDQNSIAPDTVITSVVWNMTPTVEYVIAQSKAGTFQPIDLKEFSMMSKGGASLAAYHSFESKIPADVLEKVKAKEAAIDDGTFRVPINEGQPAAKN